MIGEREKSYLGACKKGYLWSASWFLTRILSKLVKLCEFSNQGLDYALYPSPWKQVCSCTSSGVAAGSLYLRGTYSVHQSHLCRPGPIPMVTGHRTGWPAFDSTSPVFILCATLWAEKELGWWTTCPCLMTRASWGFPAAVYPCLTYRDVPAGRWRGALASSWSGNSGTCSTAAAEAEASIGVSSVPGLMRTLMDVGSSSVWSEINGF